MTIEDRLRNAIAARTRSVEPSDDGFERITEKLDDHGGDMNFDTPQTRWYLAAAAVVVLAGIAGGIAVLGDGGDGDDRTNTADQSDTTVDDTPATTGTPDGTTTSTERPTETTGSPTTTATVRPPGVAADVQENAVWPRPSSTVRFDDPVAAVRSWARFYAGYADPVVGDFQQGDNRSGEVSVRPLPSGQGPETVVLVRLLGDDGSWYVTGSITPDIDVTSPARGAQLTCPQALRGTALAYEGTVQVRIDAYQPDGDRVTVYEGFVTGSGSPPAGPFSDDVACSIPTGVESYGIARFTTVDEGDVGGVLEALTFPIRLR